MTYFDDLRAVLAVRGLSPAAKLVLLCLYDRQGGKAHAWPSIATIGKDCGGLARSTVVQCLHAIERAGLLEIDRPGKPSIRQSNRYRIDLTGLKIEPVQKQNQSENRTGTGPTIKPELVRNSDPNDSINESTNEPKIIFDAARKIYPGRKRGLSVEFEAFKKGVKDWLTVLPGLESSVRAYAAHCEHLKATGQFCPNHKDFCRWLKNRCWETEYSDPMAGATREANEAEIDALLGSEQ